MKSMMKVLRREDFLNTNVFGTSASPGAFKILLKKSNPKEVKKLDLKGTHCKKMVAVADRLTPLINLTEEKKELSTIFSKELG